MYAYGYGRLGVLQQRLLDNDDISRFLGARDEDSLRQALSEVDFTSVAMPIDTLQHFTPVMERWLMKQLSDMSSDIETSVFDILLLREDLPVIAYLLKERHRHTSGLTSLPTLCVTAYPIEAVRQAIAGKNDSQNIPHDLRLFLERMKHAGQISPEEIDDEVAAFITNKQLELARASGSRLIERYVRHTIDLQNIRTARRMSASGERKQRFLAGGEMDAKRMAADPREVGMLIGNSSLPHTLFETLKNDPDVSVSLERALSQALTHDVAAMRSVTLGLEPIFAYGIIALSQIFLIRSILIGKAAGLSGEQISPMLPPVFSASIQYS